ncbi:DUF1905 domain-containing protein [Nakamurella sp. YIM 132087]|uniref:DUF1905 domain-containing protein n=1 Tax=Nakamurella alba TaxID=2665158 RepID=A0A7K1FNF9_9ACTN|nr:YdeI/OmpD-associated family protein [Nakamurella alba]MTD15676.1 DUF1905 domain-containing protein [Nakamurella alba]
MQIRTAVVQAEGKKATGFEIPPASVAELGTGKRFKVVVTVNGGYSYRSSVASMGGAFMIPLSAEHRTAAGVQAGDEVDLTVELDEAPRELEIPEDLAAALAADPAAQAFFDGLSFSGKRVHTLAVEGAKTAETRQRRIAAAVDKLSRGIAR